MPIYEYRCTGCGNDFEMTRSISQAGEPATCPACGKDAHKLISAFASKVDYTVKVPTKEPFRAPATPAGDAATS